MLGTPAYMAPEQYEGRADARSDQFALCVALFGALYGDRPFPGSTAGELVYAVTRGKPKPAPADTDVPAALHAVIVKGLAADPDARHRDIPTLIRALQRAAVPRTRLVLAVVAAATPVVAILGVAGWWMLRSPTPTPTPANGAMVALSDVVAATPVEVPPLPPVELPSTEARPSVRPPPDPLPLPPDGLKLRTWDTSKPFLCDGENGHEMFSGVEAKLDKGPIIIATDDCHLRCTSCKLSGDVLIDASGDATIDLAGGTYEATQQVVRLSERAHLQFINGRGATIQTQSSEPAFAFSGASRAFLSGWTISAETAVFADAMSTVKLEGITLEGTTAAIKSAKGATVAMFGRVTIRGPLDLEGTLDESRREK